MSYTIKQLTLSDGKSVYVVYNGGDHALLAASQLVDAETKVKKLEVDDART